MAIIISENGKNAKRIEESHFGLEDKLQQYIYDNPDAIPLYDIDEDTRLFIAAREFSTKSGPIDALGFDASGNIYVVETKLYKNPDKRTVVAQALDYGASLWRHAIDFDDFVFQLDAHCQSQFGKGFKEQYSEFFEIEDATENLNYIKANLSDGSIKFVVLMDKLHDALKDLVVFVNQNSKFDLYAVELEYYRHKSFEIIIPKLYGAEVKKAVQSSSSSNYSRKAITQDELMSRLDSREKEVAELFISAATSDNRIGLTWRKTGFSIWTMIPRTITHGVYDYESGYSYLFFQVSEKNGELQKCISFWYPESSFNALPKLKEYVENYRNKYHSFDSYNKSKKEIQLQDITLENAKDMLAEIFNTSRTLSSLNTEHVYDRSY